MRTIKAIIAPAIPVLIMGASTLALLIALATPQKTRAGEFTNVWSYWTDTEYVCANFDDVGDLCK